MDGIYHNKLEIFVSDNLLYKGQVLIYSDNTCEGIVYDNSNNKYFIFGIFEKYKSLDLNIITKEKIEKFVAKKGYLKYTGEYTLLENEEIRKDPFYLTASSLNVDARDYFPSETPLRKFSKEKDKFKEEWFKNNKGINNYTNKI